MHSAKLSLALWALILWLTPLELRAQSNCRISNNVGSAWALTATDQGGWEWALPFVCPAAGPARWIYRIELLTGGTYNWSGAATSMPISLYRSASGAPSGAPVASGTIPIPYRQFGPDFQSWSLGTPILAQPGERFLIVFTVPSTQPVTGVMLPETGALSAVTTTGYQRLTIPSPSPWIAITRKFVFFVEANCCFVPVITTQPQSRSVCAGVGVTLSVVAQGSSPLGYQWRKGGNPLAGGNAASYTIPITTVADSGSYDCVVTNACGQDTSSPATLNVYAGTRPRFLQHPTSQAACVGSAVSFSALADGTTPISYRWFKNDVAIPGATNPTLVISPVSASSAGAYTCQASNGCGSVTSSPAFLTVLDGSPVITLQPINQTTCVGSGALFTVASSGPGVVNYAWRKNGTPIAGATNPALQITSASSGDAASYDCVLSNLCGSTTSSSAVLTIITVPTILVQPASTTVCEGTRATFSVTASGGAPYSYQWFRNAAPILGGDERTLQIDALLVDDGALIRCDVTNACGTTPSAPATLRVLPGVQADFEASTTSGCGPLLVSFSDRSRGDVRSWEWDFDFDGIVDSRERNPRWLYELGEPGGRLYTVSLRVTGANGCSQVYQRTGYVQVFGPSVNIGATPISGAAPLTVSFTSITSGAVAWEWDFDGDGTYDASTPNPSYTFTEGGWYGVRLRATDSNGCASIRTLFPPLVVQGPTRNQASAEIQHYVFNEARGSSVANIAATTAAPALGVVNRELWQADAGRGGFRGNDAGYGCLGHGEPPAILDTGASLPLNGSSFSIQWWARLRGPLPAMQRQLYFFQGDETYAQLSGSPPSQLSIRMGNNLRLEAGYPYAADLGTWHHIAFVWDATAGWIYLYLDGQLSGQGRVSNFGQLGGGPRWIGGPASIAGPVDAATRYFDLDDFRYHDHARSPQQIAADLLHEPAHFSEFGDACPGAIGRPWSRVSSAPRVPNPSFALELRRVEPARPAVLFLGASATQWFGLPLPLDLGALGLCNGYGLHVAPDLNFIYGTTANGLDVPVPIPPDGSLEGQHVYVQWVILGSLGASSAALDLHLHG